MDNMDGLQSTLLELRFTSEAVFATLLLLKLFGNLNISWWLVFSPFLFMLALTTIIIITFLILKSNEIRRKNKTVSKSD